MPPHYLMLFHYSPSAVLTESRRYEYAFYKENALDLPAMRVKTYQFCHQPATDGQQPPAGAPESFW
jgi:hypothetical protein